MGPRSLALVSETPKPLNPQTLALQLNLYAFKFYTLQPYTFRATPLGPYSL